MTGPVERPPGGRAGGGPRGAADGSWVGRPLRRVEDRAALCGGTAYVDDLHPPGLLHAAFARSGVASGVIRAVDPRQAAARSDVHAVLTASDLGGRALVAALERPFFRRTEMPLLADGAVRHVGEPVAMVIADSPYAAEDAAETVAIDLEAGRAVASIEAATAPGAPRLHPGAEGNVLVDARAFDDEQMDELLADPEAVVVESHFRFGRLSASPMEGRACLAEWDERAGRLVVHASTQAPHMLRTAICGVLELPEGRVRVIAPDVGGGFGMKMGVSREEVLVAAAARRLRRPVKWSEDRRESLASAFHGHEATIRLRAAFDRDGALLGVDADIASDVGAYSAAPMSCALEPMMAARELPGVYRFGRYRAHARAIATNKAPMAPYRGVSRPQAVFAMERTMDKAAARLGLSRADVRRRNLIDADEFPYRGPNGVVYDRGSYRESLDLCLEALEFDSWSERQARARQDGRLLGLGIACFSESTGFGTSAFGARGMRVTPGYESAEVRMEPTGEVVVALGTSSHGQGHQTTIAQIVADELGIEPADVRVLQSDTDTVPYGWGTFASRSAVVGGGACKRAARVLHDKLARLAADRLEAAPDDIELRGGRARVRGAATPAVELADLSRLAYHEAHRLPAGEQPGLVAMSTFDPPGTYSNATHGAVVEVEPATGGIRIERYVVVEDCGVIINPLIVDGQVHGGVAQGVGKTLYEQMVYDEEGQCRTASFMDYILPTASEIPSIDIRHLETPSEHSETGAKGMGEGGMIGAPAAIANAVSDALAHVEAEIDGLPITPERVWAAVRRQRGR